MEAWVANVDGIIQMKNGSQNSKLSAKLFILELEFFLVKLWFCIYSPNFVHFKNNLPNIDTKQIFFYFHSHSRQEPKESRLKMSVHQSVCVIFFLRVL